MARDWFNINTFLSGTDQQNRLPPNDWINITDQIDLEPDRISKFTEAAENIQGYQRLSSWRSSIDEEDVETYTDAGLIDIQEFAGEEFYTVSERGRYIQENAEEIKQEVSVAEEMKRYGIDEVEETLEAGKPGTEKISVQEEKPLREKHRLKDGREVWARTETGERIASALEYRPQASARAMKRSDRREPQPLEIIEALEEAGTVPDEEKLSKEIVDQAERVRNYSTEDQFAFLETYYEIATGASLPRVTSQSADLLGRSYGITGMKELYAAAKGEDSAFEIGEDIDRQEIVSELESDIQDTFDEIKRYHRMTYDH